MRQPDFLVIGAMKAGTTSLCRDMEASPSIFFPSVKEPHTLCLNEVLTPEGKARYAALFQNARPDQLCGEGSTGYTKLPTHTGVPERAYKVLGSDLKLIYIVREPVARAVSHHYHLYRAGDAPRAIGEAVRKIPTIVQFGKYAMQLEPWIEKFGRDHIHVVRFESYVRDRRGAVDSICRFLGVDVPPQEINPGAVFNSGEEQRLPPEPIKNIVRRITRSQWYKRNVHPRTPRWVREGLKAGFYQQAAPRPDAPPVEFVDLLLQHFRDDVERLREMLGEPDPFWDLDAVREERACAGASPA